jgi:hypothetical protein
LYFHANKIPQTPRSSDLREDPIRIEKSSPLSSSTCRQRNPDFLPEIVPQGNDPFPILGTGPYFTWSDHGEIRPKRILNDFSKNLVVIVVKAIRTNDCLDAFLRIEHAAYAGAISPVIKLGTPSL